MVKVLLEKGKMTAKGQLAMDLVCMVALVELEEGPRLLTNVIGIPPEDVRCEMKVKVTFDDVTPEATVPKFVPA